MKSEQIRLHYLHCALLAAATLTSCYSPLDESDTETTLGQNVTVDVRPVSWVESSTRTDVAASDNSSLFPVYYYLMNSSKKCVAIDSITTADAATDVTFHDVSSGKYTIYAVCGCDYLLTSVGKTVTVSTLLIDGVSQRDICIGSQSVTVGSALDSTIHISASHVYADLQLSVSEVPATVSAASVTLSSMYQGVAWNGKGANATGTVAVSRTLQLTKNSATEWGSDWVLMPPSSGSIAIDLTITDSGGTTKTLTSQTGVSIKAGTRTHLSATYESVQPSQLGVGVFVPAWASDTLQIVF